VRRGLVPPPCGGQPNFTGIGAIADIRKFKIGDPFEKVKELSGYTSMEERDEGLYTIFFNNMMTDESIQIKRSEDGLIECISIAPRYY